MEAIALWRIPLPFLQTLYLTGGVSSVGSSYLDGPNTIVIPLFTVGDVGLRYETAVNGTPVIMRLFALRSCPKERLILWHGRPGTGKTHALRALLREWQPWCDAAFITDAERFVGGAPT